MAGKMSFKDQEFVKFQEKNIIYMKLPQSKNYSKRGKIDFSL